MVQVRCRPVCCKYGCLEIPVPFPLHPELQEREDVGQPTTGFSITDASHQTTPQRLGAASSSR